MAPPEASEETSRDDDDTTADDWWPGRDAVLTIEFLHAGRHPRLQVTGPAGCVLAVETCIRLAGTFALEQLRGAVVPIGDLTGQALVNRARDRPT